MNSRLMTLLGLAIGPVALLLVDALFTRQGAGGAFENLQQIVRSTGLTAWPIGVLIGHWYYPGPLWPVVKRPWNYVVLGAISLVVMLGTLPLGAVESASEFVSTIVFCGGLVAGALLWSMDNPPTHYDSRVMKLWPARG